jgi:Mlc titration factor MtfA (ptsG expression regulator)
MVSLPPAFPAFWSHHAQPRSPAHHVGIHEFAHVLDFIGAEGRAHGVPGLLSSGEARRWQQQLEHERQRLQVGQSVLSPYGLKNEAELFAVAVESFFEDASHLREHHPDLYALLCAFFNQDPAARAQHAQATPQAAPPHRPWFAMGQPIRYTA